MICDYIDKEKNEMLEKVLITERIILQTLAFDLQICHPILPLFNKWKDLKSKFGYTFLIFDHCKKKKKKI